MTKTVPLTTGLGEVMAPQTLLTVLILAPDGTMTVDPGALHGRSEIENAVRFVQRRDQVPNAQVYWLIWVAVELDTSNAPMRYKGIGVSELWIDPVHKIGYKSLAESVNRMSEAMRGGITLKTLDARAKTLIRERLIALGAEIFERSSQSFKEALV